MSKNTASVENNSVLLSGEIVSPLVFSHEVYGEGFYCFDLKSDRLSGNADVLPVTISERIMNDHSLSLGSMVSINGQVRSYNSVINKRNRLVLTVFAREITLENENDDNQVFLNGYVCKPPVYRTTPFGREIADVLLAVNRAYNKSDYIPCIFWGRNAKYIESLSTGDNVLLWGRMQSRLYQKKTDETIEERVAYEISVARMETQKDDIV